jgi:bifunctional non-homologous end joining protein LigD
MPTTTTPKRKTRVATPAPGGASSNGRHTPRAHPRPAAGISRDQPILGITISNPDRVVYPEDGITKRDVAEYYAAIGQRMMPHIAGRPLTVVRCPQGRAAQCFYQKHFEGAIGPGLHTVSIKESEGKRKYLVADTPEGLVWLAQNGILEIHTWGCREDDIEHPDRIVFDLDPGPGVEWSLLKHGALDVRKRLTAAGLSPLVKTTGGKGLHIVAPVKPARSWDQLKEFCREIAAAMTAENPDAYTNIMTKSRREHRLFIDYLRNGRGATAIATWSTRARAGAPISFPLTWKQLEQSRALPQQTIRDAPRLARNRDPWTNPLQRR